MAPLQVEVVYALPEAVDAVPLSLPRGATVSDALKASGLLERHPSLRGRALRLGVYGEEVQGERLVADGDRIEVYRPLAMDPKEARRRRALARR